MPRDAIGDVLKLRKLAVAARRAAYAAHAFRWPPHSRLYVVDDEAGWVLAEEGRALQGIAAAVGVAVEPGRWARAVTRQSVFHMNQFALLGTEWRPSRNRLGVSFFHGLPGTGEPEFDLCHANLRRHHEEIDRVQVSNRAFAAVVLESGIDPAKVHRIPIGLDIARFPLQSPEARLEARRRLGIPQSAFVVGSLVKDGVGWGDGMEPKLIKGPDVLVAALARARPAIPELFAVLTAPARGYVKAGLEKAGVPYLHLPLSSYAEIPGVYAALDACLVASRQEGGPKAVLEAMASGVPLVSTRVGQAVDLVEHGVTGWLADVGDDEALAAGLLEVHDTMSAQAPLLARARAVAEAHDYAAQHEQWARLLDGFVARADHAGPGGAHAR